MNSGLFFFSPEWPIFHLDNHIIVLYKPAGILVQGDKTGRMTLIDLVRLWIKREFSKPGNVYIGLVHRLDFQVAGVMLFARTSKAASRLSHQFRERQIVKEYLAVVEGLPKEKKGKLIHNLTRKKNKTSASPYDPQKDGKPAVLSYEVVKTTGDKSLLRIIPLTGRKHQIRAQLAAIGHPIVGDRLYGAKTTIHKDGIISLVSKSITLIHPTKQEKMTITSPLPIDWPLKTGDEKSSGVIWKFDDFKLDTSS